MAFIGGSDVAAAEEIRQLQRCCGIVAALENAVLLLKWREEIRKLADVLRCAEKEIALRLQRKMEDRNGQGLKIGAEINQQIAARNEIDARKRRIAKDAV